MEYLPSDTDAAAKECVGKHLTQRNVLASERHRKVLKNHVARLTVNPYQYRAVTKY